MKGLRLGRKIFKAGKFQQVIWLDSRTHAFLLKLYVESGAADSMAYNTFLSEILRFMASDEDSVKKFINFIKTPAEEIVYKCPICGGRFEDMPSIKKHFEAEHGVKPSGKA
jgi:uncharacterized C2H2 Zn-finger protein